MKKFISITSFIALLFLSIQLSCSDNETDNSITKTESSSTTGQSTLQMLYAAATSDEAKYVAQGTALVVSTVASTIGKVAYQGIQLAAGTYNKNNEQTENYINNKTKNDSDSDSDPEADFHVVAGTTGKPNCFRNEEELKKSLTDDPNETMHQFNRFIKKSFTEENAEEAAIQSRIHEVISVANTGKHATGERLCLAAATAHSYQQQQKEIVNKKFNQHAQITALNIINERNTKTAELEKEKEEQLKKINDQFARKQQAITKKYNKKTYAIGTELRIAYENCQYLNNCAATVKDERAISPTNFTDPDKLHKMLEIFRTTDEIKTASLTEQNNNRSTPPPAPPKSDEHQHSETSENIGTTTSSNKKKKIPK